mmetsp:Transcript_25916/g.60647  ORF Transcript_25916/g.60647 Transcript_25916/m.60647 type:complete len:278 (-) Transcript_25916:47-880(-)
MRALHETVRVEGLLDTQHVAVTRKIVELVDVDSVAVIAHDVVKEVLPVPTLPLEPQRRVRRIAQHQLLDEVHVRVWIEPVLDELLFEVVNSDQVVEHRDRRMLVRPAVALRADGLDEFRIEEVRQRPVAEVVDEAGQMDAKNVGVGDRQRVLHAELVYEVPCEVRHSERVLEAAPSAPRKNVVDAAQLSEVAEALELRSVHHFYRERVEVDEPMNRIFDDLPALRGRVSVRLVRRGGHGHVVQTTKSKPGPFPRKAAAKLQAGVASNLQSQLLLGGG